MASDPVIDEVLDEIVAQYGDRQGWRERVAPSWYKGLRAVDDRVLARVVQGLMQTEEYRPKLATVLKAVAASAPRRAQDGPGSCARCSHGSVIVGRRYSVPGDGMAYEERSARCDCPAGESPSKAIALVTDIEARWRSDPATDRVLRNPSPGERSLDLDLVERARLRYADVRRNLAEQDRDDHRDVREEVARRIAGDDSFEDGEVPA